MPRKQVDRWRWQAKVTLASAISNLCRLEDRAAWARAQRRPLILGYHRVVEDFEAASRVDMPNMLISRDTFERHLDWIGRRFRFASLDEIGERAVAGSKFDEPIAAITFDDGYQDVYDVAYPLLRSKGVPAAVFVVSDLVGRPCGQTHDRLYYLLEDAFSIWNNPRRELFELLRGLGVPSGSVFKKSAVGSSAMLVVSALLGMLPQSDVARLLRALEDLVGEKEPDGPSSMTWPMIRDLQRGGITIGSHTRSHVTLPTESDEVVEQELKGSRTALEKGLGGPVDHFAYPGGHFTPRIVRALESAGYRYAYTACHHGDPLHPALTQERLLMWEGSSIDPEGRFSPPVFNCQIHAVWPPAWRCERVHHA